jgi:hypothetical protein
MAMKTIPLFPRIGSLGIVAALVLALPAALSAQEKAEVEKPTFDDLPSPEFNVGKSKSFKPKDWLEVEAKVRLPKGQGSDELFAEQMSVKWYVAVKNPDGKGVYLLTKDINFMNVPRDEDVYVSVYLSPNTIKRLTGTDRAGKQAVERVGLEVLVNGVKVGDASSQQELTRWVNAPSLARTEKFQLLDKNETPFRALWYDRYAEIQERR